MNCHPSLRARALWSRFSTRTSLYSVAFIFPSILTSLPVPAAATVLHCMDGTGQVTGSVCFSPNITHDIHSKELNFSLSGGPFGKLLMTCYVPFPEEWLPSGHSTIKAWLVDYCRDGWLCGRFSSLHSGTEEFWKSSQWVISHLPNWPFPLTTQFRWPESFRRTSDGSKVLPLMDGQGHCAHWNLQSNRHFL